MSKPMMKCGHAANAANSKGEPCCAICVGITAGASEVAPTPALAGRMAKCSCGNLTPSSLDLAFFELNRMERGVRNFSGDAYYCGHRGWN